MFYAKLSRILLSNRIGTENSRERGKAVHAEHRVGYKATETKLFDRASTVKILKWRGFSAQMADVILVSVV